MSLAAEALATFQNLLELPEDARAEILGGRVVTSPVPLPRHSNSQRALGRFVGGPFHDDDGRGGPGGWWIFIEVDVQLGVHDVVRPDLSGWRRERLADPGAARPILTPPDWVCEITSPSSEARDRVDKRALYARHGVAHYWIIDPEARILEALELREGRWPEVGAWGDAATARIPPFDAIELEIGRLFLPKVSDA